MSLETTLTDITARLRQGRFPNEQAISQGVVLRILQELGWDTWDTALVWPEYQTGEGRADFALCHPPTSSAPPAFASPFCKKRLLEILEICRAMNQRLSPTAIQALQEALAQINWYKQDLKRFLVAGLGGTALVNRVNWDNPKRQIVSDLIEILCADQDKYLGELRLLLKEVSEFRDFSHLERLEDGKRKAAEARQAVRKLHELVQTHDEIVTEHEETAERRREEATKLDTRKALLAGLEELKSRYIALVVDKNTQKRGFELEKVMYDLFRLFDLDPKASFRITGEQIDGAFTLQGLDYLFEAKWAGLVSANDMDVFASKVQRKLDNTLGLMLSVDGFQPEGVETHSKQRPVLLLMSGADLMAVLEGRIDFVDLLVRKRRHASQTGRILIEFSHM